ncbi:MAG: hypothetical protein NC093_09020 [Alistipes sp.]|nr:hypothetical protein [Alistipes sp.]
MSKLRNGDTAVEAAVAEQAVSTAEPKFTLEKLREHSVKLFGVDESTFIGATTGLAEAEYSVSEIKNTIEKWKTKEAT